MAPTVYRFLPDPARSRAAPGRARVCAPVHRRNTHLRPNPVLPWCQGVDQRVSFGGPAPKTDVTNMSPPTAP
jgi:hypothetical protein